VYRTLKALVSLSLYRKEQRTRSKAMALPVKVEFPYNKIGSWRLGNPYSVSMIYPKGGEAFCLKGGFQDINAYLDKHLDKISHVVYHNLYSNGKSRQLNDIHLVSEKYTAKISNNYKKVTRKNPLDYQSPVMKVVDGKAISVHIKSSPYLKDRVMQKIVKRAPRCWPKELSQFCED